MSDPFEVQGEWWLPHRPDRRVSGRLKVDPIEGAHLDLVGAIREWHERGTRIPGGGGFVVTEDDESGAYPRILGLADNTPFTLEDCFQTHLSSRLGTGTEYETIYANEVLKGAHFDQDEELEATGVRVAARHLATWVGESGLTVHHSRPDENGNWQNGPWASVSATAIPERSIQATDASTLTLGQTLGSSGDGVYSRSLTQDFYFRVDVAAKEPMHALVERVSGFQALVSIAVDRRAHFETVEFFHPDVEDTSIGRRPRPRPVEYFVRWRGAEDAPSEQPLRRHKMLFSLAEIGGLVGVDGWMIAAGEHRTALGRVLNSKFSPSMDVNDRVLNRAAALEAFDRKTTGTAQSKFKTRMARCVEYAGEPFPTLVGNVDAWLEVLRRERDDTAHHLGNLQLGGPETLYLSDSVYWLFVLCMFRAANLPDEVFDRVGADQSFNWLRRRLPVILP